LLNNLGTRIKFLSKISYSITLIIWILGTLLFI
jgi:hypothetical protein